MNFFSNVLKPVTLDILSNTVIDLKTSVRFLVTFEIQFFFFGKRLRFETTGTLVTDEVINQDVLSDIINLTDYTKYMDLNIKNIDKGNFDYEYLYGDSLLTINYTTVGPESD